MVEARPPGPRGVREGLSRIASSGRDRSHVFRALSWIASMALVMALPTAEWHVLTFLWPTARRGLSIVVSTARSRQTRVRVEHVRRNSTAAPSSGRGLAASFAAQGHPALVMAKRVLGADHKTTRLPVGVF